MFMIPTVVNLILLVGSYGTPDDPTLHTYSFDSASGTAVAIDSADGLLNPSFLAVADGGDTLLAVSEADGDAAGLYMLRRTAPGRYSLVDKTATGDGPCHVAVSPDGRYAVTANYSGGSIAIIGFDRKGFTGEAQTVRFTGRGPVERRQELPHAHFTSFTPDGRLMVVDDLGTDRLHIFPIDSRTGRPDTARMHDVELAAGAGPRHLVYDNTGKYAYVINEIDGTVTRLLYAAAGATLRPLDSVLADYEHGHGGGDIHLSPDGRYLYVSNRLKGDGIAIFAVDAENGRLTEAGFMPTGRHPRNFAITPDGAWVLVAARDDNRIEIYRRDAENGSLAPTGQVIACPKPVCVIAL